ncbi:MAG: hypothetical protein RL364_771, partial [Pseudomonadota bacterium]
SLLTGTVLASAMLWWAWRQLDWPAVQGLWQAVPLWSWGLAVLAWSGSFVFRAQRLRQEWRWKQQASWRQALRVVLLHNAAVLVLPLRAGEMGYPWMVRQVFGASWREALRSLMWLRLQDAVVLGALAWLLWPQWTGPWRFLPLMALCLLAVPARRWRWLLSRRHAWMARLRPWMHRRGQGAGWGLSLGNWLLKMLVVACLLHAMLPPQTGLDGSRALAAALGGELAALIPVQGPVGLGTYEVGVWWMSGLDLQAAPLLGMAALLVHGFCLLVSLGLAGAWNLLALLTRAPAQTVRN